MEKWVEKQKKAGQRRAGGAGDWKERGRSWTMTLEAHGVAKGLLESAREKQRSNQKKSKGK